MKLNNSKYFIALLGDKNYKSFYLAFLRIAISLWLINSILINWSDMDLLYGNSTFVVPKNNFISKLPGGGFELIKNYYLLFFCLFIFVIILNITGIGKWFTALLIFLMFDLTQKMNMSMVDGGNKMVRDVLLIMIFADSYQYFTLVKKKDTPNDEKRFRNLISNLAALSIMFQLCIAYFSAALAKLNSPIWLNGEAVYYSLQLERFMGTPFNKWIAQHRFFDLIANYAVLFIELLFPIFIWVKKTRTFFLIAGIMLHISIYVFMMIYGFQIVFMLIYGLFLPNDLLLKYAHKIQRFFGIKQGAVARYIGLGGHTIPVQK